MLMKSHNDGHARVATPPAPHVCVRRAAPVSVTLTGAAALAADAREALARGSLNQNSGPERGVVLSQRLGSTPL